MQTENVLISKLKNIQTKTATKKEVMQNGKLPYLEVYVSKVFDMKDEGLMINCDSKNG